MSLWVTRDWAGKLEVRPCPQCPLATVGLKKAACREGPTTDSCSATNKFHHSITSSARAKSVGGIVNPSALFRLMISSNLMLCWMGRSAGLAPLKFFRCRSLIPADRCPGRN